VKSQSVALSIDPVIFRRATSTYVPAGAIPKDGLSAGV
jgi:ATP-dependent Lon protease